MRNEDTKYVPALSYDWLTFFYDPVARLTTREKTFKAALIRQAKIADGQRVLDLGCGTGTLTLAAKRKTPGCEITGLDGDPAILKQAAAKARRAGLPIVYDEGMSFALPYADGWFDRVLSSLHFHHLTRESKLKTLAEAHRTLKRGGELHIADWGTPDNLFMRLGSFLVQKFDGIETTADSFNGLLPQFAAQMGFVFVEETSHFNTLFGTIRLLRARKP
ncbi:MAG: class I SAM-dependent methyltransferase [Acidobacteria bacterium]|nr:class I SAM-dependent methyltransferase [Acidobacteriota bacterium]